MLIDLDNSDFLPNQNYQYAIIGAGIAGITLALELSNEFDNILLLESGGLVSDEKKQDDHGGITQYYGINSNHGKYYLRDMRLRYFGGTSNHWAGHCSLFDPIDFEKRDYVKSPGWDIPYQEYYSYVSKAAEYAGLEDSDFGGIPQDFKKYPSLFSADSSFEQLILKASQSPRYHERFLERVGQSDKITCVLNATLTDADFDYNQKYQFKSVKFKNNNLKEFEAKSDQYAFCMGSAEIIRFLLNINEQYSTNIGNQLNNLGKGFMEHLYITNFGYGYRYGKESPVKSALIRVNENISSGKKTYINYRLKDEVQKKLETHNNQIGIWSSKVLNKKMISDLDKEDLNITKLIRKNFFSSTLWMDELNFRADLPPDPSNLFFLSNRVDRFNRKKISLRWGCTTELKAKFRDFMVLFAKEYAIQTGGRVKITLPNNEEIWDKNVTGGGHMMGGTPISSNPRKGIVTPDLRIHNTSNVYIASSSVFPTAGGCHPTINIIALTVRLADYFKKNPSNSLG